MRSLRVCIVEPVKEVCDFLLKVWLWYGIDMKVMSGIYGFLHVALLPQGQGQSLLGDRLYSSIRHGL